MLDYKANAQPPVLAVKGYPRISVLCTNRNFAFFGKPYPVEPLAVLFLAARNTLQFDMCIGELNLYIVLIETEVAILFASEFWVSVHIVDCWFPVDASKM